MSPIKTVQEVQPPEPSFLHCGTCSKCRERHDAFLAAGVPDPTDYVDATYVRQ
jgi:7-cyano-7-deazaguanine synthase in queuosine biosynthesis